MRPSPHPHGISNPVCEGGGGGYGSIFGATQCTAGCTCIAFEIEPM